GQPGGAAVVKNRPAAGAAAAAPIPAAAVELHDAIAAVATGDRVTAERAVDQRDSAAVVINAGARSVVARHTVCAVVTCGLAGCQHKIFQSEIDAGIYGVMEQGVATSDDDVLTRAVEHYYG